MYTELLLNESYNDFEIVTEEVLERKVVFYLLPFEDNNLHTLKELIGTISKKELENFITMTVKYFKNIEIEYLDYKIVEGEKNTPVPQVIIQLLTLKLLNFKKM